MKRNKLAAALLSVVLFLCGIAVGALGQRFYDSRAVIAGPTAENFRRHYLGEMRSRLKLTPAQEQQLEAILDDTKAKYKSVRDQFHPQMLAIKNEQISRVKAILTPQQIPEYDRIVAEHERRARDMEAHDHHADRKPEPPPAPGR